jgi:hypothetical protein
MNWGRAERETGRVLRALDTEDLHDHLDAIRGHLQELSHAASRTAHQQLGRAREFAVESAHDAEETMKDHLAASLVLALSLGVAIGYLIRRETE